MKLSFERVLIGFFVAIILAVVLLGAANFHNNRSYHESARAVDHTNEVLKLNATTLTTIQDLAIRSFLTTGDASLLETYRRASGSLSSRIAQFRELTSDNPLQQHRIDSLAIYAGSRMALTTRYLAMYQAHELNARDLEEYTLASRLSMIPIRRISADIADTEESLLAARKLKTEKDKSDADFSIALVFGLIALLLIGCTAAVIYYIRVRQNFEASILKLNADLEKKIEELHNSNKELESFSYSVSHDLRAPLRIIDGFAKIISEEHTKNLDAEGLRFVETIRTNAQRMGLLIDDLLNFSRIGRQELALREIDMNNLVQRVVDNFTLLDQCGKANIQVRSLGQCKGDEKLLQQVWINLVSNAIKYSRNQAEPSIVIGCDQKPAETIYYVRDNGVGFDMEFSGKLFGVFQRLHKASDYEGTGVGLALVSRIISKHKGRVWANAKTNEGATFSFAIPKQVDRTYHS